MRKIMVSFFITIAVCSVMAQPQSREELEKQRQQLKKEMEATESLLKENKSHTKESFVQWKLLDNKVNIQDRVIDNINHDIDLLDNNIYQIQRDINRYDRLLDTLKLEYAKSMEYAYKNRSNYDFLNFIFSAGSFNDAIKRISYLKSYRSLREMQGQQILRTQELRHQRVEEITGVKQKKNTVLDVKSREMDELEKQRLEKDRVLAELKKQQKKLNNQFAAKKKQYLKVQNSITAAIKKAQDDARKAAAAEEEKKRLAALKNNNTNPITINTNPIKRNPIIRDKPKKEMTDFPLSAESAVLNASFEKNKGALPWPVEKGYILLHYGPNELPSRTILVNPGITIATDIGTPVKVVFRGVISSIVTVEDMQVVIIQHGRYFSTYSNLGGVSVQKGQTVEMGQVIGKAMSNEEGVGAVDLIMSNEKGNNMDPQIWLRRH